MSKTFQATTIGTALLSSALLLAPNTASAATASPVSTQASVSASATQESVEEVINPPDMVTYVVQPGDSLSGIGQKYCVSWQTIYADNENVIGTNPNLIVSGEKLTFPKGSCSGNSSNVKTTPTNYVNGTPQHIAWMLLPKENRAVEYECLNSIIMSESSWNIHAYNPSGAYGIPQALPGSKMAGPWGTDWEDSAYVQLYWMIRYYIPKTYGTMCDAWGFHLAHGYY